MNRPGKKQQSEEQALALVWLLGGAPLTLLLSGFIHFLGVKPWLCAALFICLHTALLRLHLGEFDLAQHSQLRAALAFWTADLIWLALLMGPWVLAGIVCLLISTGLVLCVLWRVVPWDSMRTREKE